MNEKNYSSWDDLKNDIFTKEELKRINKKVDRVCKTIKDKKDIKTKDN